MRSTLPCSLALVLALAAAPAAADELHPAVERALYVLNDHSRAMEPLGVDPEKAEEKHQAAESLRQQASLLEKLAGAVEDVGAAWPAESELGSGATTKVTLQDGAVPPGHRTRMTVAQVREMLPELRAWALRKALTVKMLAERLDPSPADGASPAKVAAVAR
jgi:hypothetical protein